MHNIGKYIGENASHIVWICTAQTANLYRNRITVKTGDGSSINVHAQRHFQPPMNEVRGGGTSHELESLPAKRFDSFLLKKSVFTEQWLTSTRLLGELLSSNLQWIFLLYFPYSIHSLDAVSSS